MKKFLLGLLKYVKWLLLVLVITVLIGIIISNYTYWKLSDIFLYAGLIYMFIGLVSLHGDAPSLNNVPTQCLYAKSEYDASVDNYMSKYRRAFFLIFMGIVGILLLIISFVLVKYPVKIPHF